MSLHLAKLRFDGGLTSEIPYQQAQVELARTEVLLPEIERRIKLKEGDMAVLLGNYSDSIPRGKLLSEQSLPDYLPIGIPSDIMKQRPDIQAAEMRLQEANAKVGVAYTNQFPHISLTASYGFESDELKTLLKSPAGFIAGTLLQPIFDMGKNRARYKIAQAQYEQEVYQYEKSVLEAFNEVRNAIVKVRKAKEVRISREKLENTAKEYGNLAELQYINGVTNYMDVMDAQREYLDAQLGLNNAILDELLSIVDLYKALGGGL